MDLNNINIEQNCRFMNNYNPIDLEDIKDEKLIVDTKILVKELKIFNIDIEDLIHLTPSNATKNDLINIAYKCSFSKEIIDYLKLYRKLPYEIIVKYTNSNINYLKKWKNYVLCYILILARKNNSSLYSFLNLDISYDINNEQNEENKEGLEKPEKIISMDKYKDNNEIKVNNDLNINEDSISLSQGVILNKSVLSGTYILTPNGDFNRILPECEFENRIGHITSGKVRRSFKFIKRLVFVGIFFAFLVASMFIYNYFKVNKTIIISGNAYVTLKINKFDVVTNYECNNSNLKLRISKLNLKHESVDNALYELLKFQFENEFLNENDEIIMSINGNNKTMTDMTKTKKFVEDNNIKVKVNNNGYDHKF